MIRLCLFAAVLVSTAAPIYWVQTPIRTAEASEELWHHRNLGKAYYENPTTHRQAEEEFAKAVAISNSLRDRIN